MALRVMVAGLAVALVLLSVLGTLYAVERSDRGRLATEAQRLEAEIEQLHRELDVIEAGG